MANGDDARACRSPSASYGLLGHGAAGLEPEAEAVLSPNGTSRVTFTSSIWYRSTTVTPVAAASSSRACISSSRSPWSTASRIVASAREERLALQLEVLGQREHELVDARPGDLVVPVGDVLLDGDRRERRRIDVAGHPADDVVAPGTTTPRAEPGDDDADADDDDRSAATAVPPGRAPTGRQAGGEPAELVAGSSPGTAAGDRAAGGRRRRRRGRRAGRPWCRTRWSAAPSAACWPRRRGAPNTTRPTRPAGTVFGSVIMKNRKISTSGEVTITRQ